MLSSVRWTKLDVGTEITFGGDNGALRLRGKSSGGTASADSKYAFISFGDSKVKVTCSGDIRTLVDYDNYVTVSTANARFSHLFQGCSSLTTAPILPATTLVKRCYSYMFNDCKKLDNITMLATDISAPNCLNVWVSGVASTGTFTKAASLEQGTESGQIPTGIYGIPEGWTVKNYGE